MDATQGLGFGHFLAQTDGVAKTILIIMLLASVTSWYLIITKAIANTRARRRSARFLDFFWNAPSLNEVALKIEDRSEEHTSELQSLMRISYAVFCLKKKKNKKHKKNKLQMPTISTPSCITINYKIKHNIR